MKIISFIIIIIYPLFLFSQKEPPENYDYNLYLKDKNPFFSILGFEKVQTINKKKTYKLKSMSGSIAHLVIEDCKLLDIFYCNEKGDTIKSDNFKDGNGTVIVNNKRKTKEVIGNFANGLLQDTTLVFIKIHNTMVLNSLLVFNKGLLNGECINYSSSKNGRYKYSVFVYKNGILLRIYYYGFLRDRSILSGIINFSEIHDTDKLRQENIYDEKGKLIEIKIYDINGQIIK